MDPFGGGIPGIPQLNSIEKVKGFVRMQLHLILDPAEESLRNGDLVSALQGFNAAFNHCCSCGPFLEDEVKYILSKCSFIHCKLGDAVAALDAAQSCIARDQMWAEGYLRAALAFRRMNKPYNALEKFMQGFTLTLQHPSINQQYKVDILTELITMITQTRRHQVVCSSFLASQGHLNPGSTEEQVILLEQLAENKCWEGVSLLVTGEHAGLRSSLDFSSPNCSANAISVGSLLKDLSVNELRRYGIQLAVALLKNGAQFKDIEKIWKKPAFHVVVVKTIETEQDELLKWTFKKYLDSQEKKDIVDINGSSILHVIVQFESCDEEKRNTLVTRCIQNGCSPFVFDNNDKLAIEYCKQEDQCHKILTEILNNTERVRSSVTDLKEKGNTAKLKKNYKEALKQYARALKLSKNDEDLKRDRAVLYTNRCTVLSDMNKLQDALENAELAITTDSSWSKGHWRKAQLLRKMKRFFEAFEASMIGQNLPGISKEHRKDIILEGIKSFRNLSESEKGDKYEALSCIPVDNWPSVLQNLSKQGEWMSIKELVLGFGNTNLSDARGVAKDVDFTTISYSTLIPFMVMDPELDRKVIGSWLIPLIVHIGKLSNKNNQQNVLKFKEHETDTPLHFAARLSVMTENTTLLQHMDEISKKMSLTDGVGNSPLHSIISMPRPPETDAFLEVIKTLLRMGVSPELKNRDGKIALECVDRSRDPQTFLLLNNWEDIEQGSKMENVSDALEKQETNPKSNEVIETSLSRVIPPNTGDNDLMKDTTEQMSNSTFKSSKNAGDKAFKARKFEDALVFYKKAKLQMEESKHIERMHLFCNVADCLQALNRYQEIIENANEFPEIDNFFQVHLRIGRAYIRLSKFKQGFLRLSKAIQLSSNSQNSQIVEDIMYEMAKCFLKCQRKDLGIRDLEKVKGYCHWIRTLFKLIQNDEWKTAEQFYMCLSTWSQGIQDFQGEFDLKPLCDINKLQQNQWVIDLILDLLANGSDYHSLYIEKGESFLHACVRITLATGNPELLHFVLEKAKQRGEQNIQDSHDNTVLHLTVNTGVIGAKNPSYQMYVVQTLLEAGVDPLIQNRQKKLASKCVSKKFSDIREFIRKQEKIQQTKIKNLEMENRRQEEIRRKQQQEERRRHHEERERHKKIREEKRKADLIEEDCHSKCLLFLETAKLKIKSKDIRIACHELQKVFQMTKHKSDNHKQIENEGLALIINAFGIEKSPDIPERLTRIPMKTYRKIVRGLAENEHWKQMHIAVTEYRKQHNNTGLHDFADGLSVTQVIKCQQYEHSKDLLTEIVVNMLNSGSSLSKDGKQEIEMAVQTNNFKVLKRLFDFGADPVHLSVNSGDTPTHAALQIALDRDEGNTSILEMFLDNPALDSSQLNLFGESLFHVIAKTKLTDTAYEVTRMLCEKGVNSNIKDSDGKLPVDYLRNKNDRRSQYFRLAFREADENTSKNEDDYLLQNDNGKSNTQLKKKEKDKSEPVTQLKKQKLREEIVSMIEELKDISMYSDELMSRSRKRKEVHNREKKHDLDNKKNEGKGFPETPHDRNLTKDEHYLMEEYQLEIETGVFDNSEWEIECTSEVWEKITSSKLAFPVLKEIFKNLEQFAKGDFTSLFICKSIDPGDLFKTIEILESGPILWEIATCFSPRLTGAEADSKNVYTETVRIWDIVENAKEKEESLKRITESYLRGGECMIEKYITCSDKSDEPCFNGRQRIPRKYLECSKSNIKFQKTHKVIFPSSYIATEYHILKFYSFSTDMAKCAVQSADGSKDFPFKVTELEHSIINLCSPAPILLLGRSGTGKTTCCLYRLYHRYDTISRNTEEPIQHKENEMQNDVETQHIRQLFVTKNLVLCNEVQKTFCEIRNAKWNRAMENRHHPVPERLEDLQNDDFPMFSTSKKLLLMIDGSLKNPFFKRDSSGKLSDEVPGWGQDDDSLSFLPKLDDDSDTESDEQSDDEAYSDDMNCTNAHPQKSCLRREVTYDMFSNLIWPKIRKGFEEYHPSLVWMEIISFIKGSYEALVQQNGYLSKDDYIEHGQKKAPNFTGKREQIYEIFLRYKHFVRQRFWFDEADVVKDIFHRIREEDINNWNIQEVYVDETQDFTQAELYLLLRICKNPNNMFLTGDTAQSIMRGISFRFKDLSSLFYHAGQRTKDVKVPEKIHQLSHNYRSHTGVLYLATSVLDILVEFFPESFDILQTDQGLFNGPPPILLEICESSDLAVLLQGKSKSTSRIEFGAHQAVLVANDTARNNLPEALQQGIVLTIYEAKGLEFDDILLYNFFKDSQAKKEWRVVTQLLERWCKADSEETIFEDKSKSLMEIDYNVFKECNRPRPLAFDPNKHKVLNTELKQLYTAITRARVNVWIFDESEEARAPMFEYFKARQLVQTVKGDETGGFAEASTPDEWIRSGEKFMAKSIFDTAATCFRRGGDYQMEKIAKCHQKAVEASRMHDAPTLMKELFLSAAHDFLECERPVEAGKCLENAKELSLSANLYKKTNQLEKASEIYIKLRLPLDGSKCLEEAGLFKKALRLLCDHSLFEAAIDCLHRYQILVKKNIDKGKPIPERLRENAPDTCYSEETLSLKAAQVYLRQGQIRKMKTFLDRLPPMDRVEFLTKNDRVDDAISILKLSGNPAVLIECYLNDGRTKEAVECAEQFADNMLKNKCLVFHSLMKTSDLSKLDMDEKKEICEKLEKVYYVMHDSQDKTLAGRAALIIGKIGNNQTFVQKAYGSFENCTPYENFTGELECMHWMTLNSDLTLQKNISKCILGMQTLYKALNILLRPVNHVERKQLEDMLKYCGFHKSGKEEILHVFPRQNPMALKTVCKIDQSKHVCSVKSSDACKSLFRFYADRGYLWKNKLEKQLLGIIDTASPLSPEPCIIQCLENRIKCIELEMHIRDGAEELERRGTFLDKELGSLKHVPFYAHCECILKDIFQDSGKITLKNMQNEGMQQVLYVLRKPRNKFFHRAMESYMQYLIRHQSSYWKNNQISSFLCLLFVREVFGLNVDPIRILKQISEIVKSEMLESMAGYNEKGVNLCGFEDHTVDEQKQTLTVTSICSTMLESQRFLKQSNVVKAVQEFGKFCRDLSHCYVDLLPCFSQLLYWMEFYLPIFFISTTALLAKPKEKETQRLLIPESYYKHTLTLGCFFSDKYNVLQNMTGMVRLARENESAYLETLSCISDLICGNEMNLFDFIFNSDDIKAREKDKNVFSERLLVLSLVVFCNLRAKFFCAKEIEKHLALKIISLMKSRKSHDLHNKKKMMSIAEKQNKGPSMFQYILSEILRQREDDNLVCLRVSGKGDVTLEKGNMEKCRKTNFLNEETNDVIRKSAPRGSGNFTSRPKDTSSNRDKKNENTYVHPDASSNCQSDKLPKESVIKIDTKNTQDKKSESIEETSKSVILRCMRNIIFRKKVKKLVTTLKHFFAKEKEEKMDLLFKDQEENKMQCGICGISYVSDGDEPLVNQNDTTVEQTATINQQCESTTKTPIIPSATNKPQRNLLFNLIEEPFQSLRSKRKMIIEPALENPEDHLKSDAHRAKEMDFKTFHNKFSTVIYDVIHSIERFFFIYDLGTDTKDTMYATFSPQIKILVGEHKELELLIKQIVQNRDWGNTEVDKKVEVLLNTFLNLKVGVINIAQKAKQERKNKWNNDAAEKEKKPTKPKRIKYKQKFTFSAS